MNNKSLKNQKGFTLMELIVAIGVFSIVVGINTNMFINAIQAQRKALIVQNVSDNARYVMETISREIRVARVGTILLASPSDIAFTSNSENRRGQNVRFYLNAETVMFDDGTGAASITSSTNTKVTSLNFTIYSVSGQPKVTVTLSAQSTNPDPAIDSKINLQTTISPREINL